MKDTSRTVIFMTKERYMQGLSGKAVNLTQSGKRYSLRLTSIWCCEKMKELMKSRQATKLMKDMRSCPFCSKTVIPSGGNAHPRKSNGLKGCKRVRGSDGKIHWVKPNQPSMSTVA